MAEMLKIDHICKTFNAGTINEKVALNGVDLTLEDGDFVIHNFKRCRRCLASGFR